MRDVVNGTVYLLRMHDGRVYVGQTTRAIERRVAEHRKSRRVVAWEVLSTHRTRAELRAAEKAAIRQYNAEDPRVGLNARSRKGGEETVETELSRLMCDGAGDTWREMVREAAEIREQVRDAAEARRHERVRRIHVLNGRERDVQRTRQHVDMLECDDLVWTRTGERWCCRDTVSGAEVEVDYCLNDRMHPVLADLRQRQLHNEFLPGRLRLYEAAMERLRETREWAHLWSGEIP